MSAAATPGLARDQTYAALLRRNRLVGLLRFAVPAAGGVLLLVVLGGILLDSLRGQFSFASVRIDRDNLVVDIPKVTATDDAGTLYSATARTAKVRVGAADVVDMIDAELTMTPSGGPTFTLAAPDAALATVPQTLTVAGTLAVRSSDGLTGTLTDVLVDVLSWTVEAHGPVDLMLGQGMRVEAASMAYEGAAETWTFDRATVTLPDTPGAAP